MILAVYAIDKSTKGQFLSSQITMVPVTVAITPQHVISIHTLVYAVGRRPASTAARSYPSQAGILAA
jgi:hypothetical protein